MEKKIQTEQLRENILKKIIREFKDLRHAFDESEEGFHEYAGYIYGMLIELIFGSICTISALQQRINKKLNRDKEINFDDEFIFFLELLNDPTKTNSVTKTKEKYKNLFNKLITKVDM